MEGSGGAAENRAVGRDLLDVLLARQEFVACLSEHPRTKPELVVDCQVSRSTVDRGIADLEEAGLVRRTRGRYELTLFGEIVAHEFDKVFDRMVAFAEVREFVAALPGDADLDATLFADATVRRGGGMGITTAMETLAGASRVRIVDPPLPLLYMGLVRPEPQLDGGSLTVLVREEMLTELAAHVSETLVAFDHAGNRLQRLDRPLPFSFALLDGPTGTELCLLLGSGERGLAVVTTSDAAAVEWGEGLYATLTERADLVDAEAVIAD